MFEVRIYVIDRIKQHQNKESTIYLMLSLKDAITLILIITFVLRISPVRLIQREKLLVVRLRTIGSFLKSITSRVTITGPVKTFFLAHHIQLGITGITLKPLTPRLMKLSKILAHHQDINTQMAVLRHKLRPVRIKWLTIRRPELVYFIPYPKAVINLVSQKLLFSPRNNLILINAIRRLEANQ